MCLSITVRDAPDPAITRHDGSPAVQARCLGMRTITQMLDNKQLQQRLAWRRDECQWRPSPGSRHSNTAHSNTTHTGGRNDAAKAFNIYRKRLHFRLFEASLLTLIKCRV